jgi:hypothetical protein
MTEEQWLSEAVSEKLLNHVKGKLSERKLRLYAVACCRRVVDDGPGRAALEAAERFADDALPKKALTAAKKAYRGSVLSMSYVCSVAGRSCWGAVRFAARFAVEHVAHGPIWAAAAISDRLDVCEQLRASEKRVQADLMRDVAGNLFRPVALDPAWLTWRDATIVKLAQTIYADRAFERLGILADALEEAGCHDAVLLGHCRGNGLHAKGCWAVDALVGKG